MKDTPNYTVRQNALVEMQEYFKNTLHDHSVYTNLERQYHKIKPRSKETSTIAKGFWWTLGICLFILFWGGLITSLFQFSWLALLATFVGLPSLYMAHRFDSKGSLDPAIASKLDENYRQIQICKYPQKTYLFDVETLHLLCNQAIIYGEVGPDVHVLIEALGSRLADITHYLSYKEREIYSETAVELLEKAGVWPVLGRQEQMGLTKDLAALTARIQAYKSETLANESSPSTSQTMSR